MSRAEALTRAFYAFELRGRGWLSYDEPVHLEPPFVPFQSFAKPASGADDGHRPSLFERLIGKRPQAAEVTEPEPLPPVREFQGHMEELLVSLPQRATVGTPAAEGLLRALADAEEPIGFEVVGTSEGITTEFVALPSDLPYLVSQVAAFVPEASMVTTERLVPAWQRSGPFSVVSELGLAHEFMLPLARAKLDPDPLLSLYAALSDMKEGELGAYQVLFTRATAPWSEHGLRAAALPSGAPLFDAEFLKGAREKLSRPLVAVVIRLAVRAPSPDALYRILRGMTFAFGVFDEDDGNGLIPLSGDDDDLERLFLSRQTRRPGMLLNLDELLGLVHLPGPSVALPALRRDRHRSAPAPAAARGDGILLGVNHDRGVEVEVRVPLPLRLRHMHLVGATGTGKSNLLLSLMTEDIEAGRGVALLDPHGDLSDALMARIPEERLSEVILFDPASFPIAWNILEAHSPLEEELLSSDLVGVFRRLATSWGDQMTAVLGNAILAILSSTEGGTLLELRQFLVDRPFRERFLASVADPVVRSFWKDEFPTIGTRSVGPLLTRLDSFLRPRIIRAMLGARESKLDLRKVVDQGQIFVGKLSGGLVGHENAALLGSLLLTKFEQVAMSRQNMKEEERRPFFLYADEAQEVAVPSLAGLLSGARKYGIGLTLAHQEMRSLERAAPEVASGLLANAGVRVVFRVGDHDARALASGFSSFEASDLESLGTGEAICRLEGRQGDCNLMTKLLPRVPSEVAARRQAFIAENSRTRYGAIPEPRVEKGATAERWVGPPRLPPPPVVEAPSREVPAAVMPPAPLGRGGPEHQYLQALVQRLGESAGYRAILEKPLPDGGRVDVSLERDLERIAVEISVTTEAEHEVGNARKCLAAGYPSVLLLVTNPRRAKRLTEECRRELGEGATSVRVVGTEELMTILAGTPGGRTVGGYRVKVRYGSGQEQDDRGRKLAIEVISRSLGRLGSKSGS